MIVSAADVGLDVVYKEHPSSTPKEGFILRRSVRGVVVRFYDDGPNGTGHLCNPSNLERLRICPPTVSDLA